MAKTSVEPPTTAYNNRLRIEKSKKVPKTGDQKSRKRSSTRNAIHSSSLPKSADSEATDVNAYNAAAMPMCARQNGKPLPREMRPSTSSSSSAAAGHTRISDNRYAKNAPTGTGPLQAAISPSQAAESTGWLRLGDMAIGDGSVCVTSLIKDKIREYMLNEEQQTDSVAAPSKSDGTCVRRIGNSLDLLLRESRKASRAVAATATKNKTSPSAATSDDPSTAVTTVIISAPADSSRPTAADGSLFPPPPPPTYANRYRIPEDEMQISRMPIPADNCSNSEIMSADATNTSDSKSSDVETTTKMNGDSHKKLNGTAVVESSNDTNEINETSEVAVKEGNIKSSEIKEPESNPESSQSVDEPPKNGASSEEEQRECDGNAENTDQVETSLSTTTVDDKPKDSPNKVEEAKPKIDQNQANEVVVIKQENQLNEVVVIKLEPETEVYNPETAVGVEMEKLQNSVHNGEVSHSDEVIKNGEEKSIPVNGRVKVEVDKVIESEKEKNIQKVPEEEDMSSEMSTDALSPKQIDEPVARKRSAASHDELSVVSGASSDNDLPKTKKLRSDEDVPLIKDDTRERLIKNIVHSSGKNEVELSRNIEKIQNEIKVITEIAQTKRDELVTLIRLQKLKEEIIERLMIKVKELDAMKTDNSKDWNLPEMFQINLSRNLSQSEHILNEKNVLDIIDNRDNLIEKSMTTSYEQNNYAAPSSSTSITPVVHHTAMNAHSNDWIMADRANRTNQRVQRVILPKPSAAVNNQKEGRQGPILDVKLIIADHRSKNPETAVPKRGRRKAPVNDFSAPTSSTQMRYPNPMSFNNPIHHANDGNFKTTVTNSHGVPNNVLEHGSDHNRFKDVPAFPEVTLHPVSQPMQQQLQQPTSLLHGILTKGTHHLPLSMSNPPTNYSPTLARLLTAPERCKQPRGKQRQPPAATVVSSNTQSRNEITITPVQSTSMSTTFQPKPSVASNIPSTQQVDDEDASDRLVIDEGQDVVNANSPSSAPQCQGCMQKPAQFVCAGCGNQWYCSKDCQIDAWDDHSEVCSG